MYVILIIIGGVLLFVSLLFGSLYLGARSQGFVVPKGYLLPETILHFPLDSQIVCPGNVHEEMAEIDGVALEGVHRAALLQCTVQGEPVVIAVIYWDDEESASRFWRRYYRAVSSHHVRKGAFRNNLWKPKFVVGRFGSSAPFDLSAWYQENWFFLVKVSTKIKDHNKVKVTIKNQLLEHIKKLSF
jgi:hypothetical protein